MEDAVKFGFFTIGRGHTLVIIAEGCDNHGGSLGKAKKMALAAKSAGADIIKFQLHFPDEEMVKSEMEKVSGGGAFKKWGSLYGFIEANLLKPEEHALLKRYCEKIGIQYLCTPFSLKAALFLKKIGVFGLKIGSGETEDMLMVEEIAKMGLPLIVSTGMTTLKELDSTVSMLKRLRARFCLAHCVSVYPVTKLSQLSLGTIGFYEKRYKVPVGWSDHTPPEGIMESKTGRNFTESELISAVVGAGACFIEKHFTLDRKNADADSYFSHNPVTLRKLVSTVRAWESAFPVRRKVLSEEMPVRIWAKRSIVASVDIRRGSLITRRIIASKRPGVGILSKEYGKAIGKKAKRDIKKGELIRWKDLS